MRYYLILFVFSLIFPIQAFAKNEKSVTDKIIENVVEDVADGAEEYVKDELGLEPDKKKHGKHKGKKHHGPPDHARERAADSNASEVARERSAVHSEERPKRWWEFWK